jgi:hypothetical protein
MIRLDCLFRAVLISAAAAPLLFYWSLVAAWQVTGEPAWAGSQDFEPGGVMFLLLLSLYYGLLIALVPNLIGIVLMSALGGQQAWARSPWAWGAVGALPALLLTIALDMPSEVPDLAFATTVAGIGSVLISRAFIRWRRPARSGYKGQA